MEPLTSAWVQSDVEYSPFPDPYLSAGIFNATRGRSRPPPPPRRHPITAAVAAITAPIITATPVAISTSECATIDATALSRPRSPDALHGQAHLGTVTTASTVGLAEKS